MRHTFLLIPFDFSVLCRRQTESRCPCHGTLQSQLWLDSIQFTQKRVAGKETATWKSPSTATIRMANYFIAKFMRGEIFGCIECKLIQLKLQNDFQVGFFFDHFLGALFLYFFELWQKLQQDKHKAMKASQKENSFVEFTFINRRQTTFVTLVNLPMRQTQPNRRKRKLFVHLHVMFASSLCFVFNRNLIEWRISSTLIFAVRNRNPVINFDFVLTFQVIIRDILFFLLLFPIFWPSCR